MHFHAKWLCMQVVKYLYNNMFSKISKINTIKANTAAGFTLVEVLVSMSLFTVVVTMSMGTLLVLIDANAKQQNIQTAMTNLSFALDSMTREIRTGYFYECRANVSALTSSDGPVNNDCSSGASNFAFTETGGSLTDGKGSARIAYSFNSTDNSIERRLGTTGVWQRLTAPEVVVQSFGFIVTDTDSQSASSPNLKSPTVTIFVSGTAGTTDGLDDTFDIQTTVTQQLLDL